MLKKQKSNSRILLLVHRESLVHRNDASRLRWSVVQGAVWPDLGLVLAPLLDDDADFSCLSATVWSF